MAIFVSSHLFGVAGILKENVQTFDPIFWKQPYFLKERGPLFKLDRNFTPFVNFCELEFVRMVFMFLGNSWETP